MHDMRQGDAQAIQINHVDVRLCSDMKSAPVMQAHCAGRFSREHVDSLLKFNALRACFLHPMGQKEGGIARVANCAVMRTAIAQCWNAIWVGEHVISSIERAAFKIPQRGKEQALALRFKESIIYYSLWADAAHLRQGCDAGFWRRRVIWRIIKRKHPAPVAPKGIKGVTWLGCFTQQRRPQCRVMHGRHLFGQREMCDLLPAGAENERVDG